MLVELTIRNFAVIENLTIRFGSGLNVLSGETGAGKSVIIQTLQLVLGNRGGPPLIRTGSEEATVDAYIELPDKERLSAKIADMGIDVSEGVAVRRMISRTGRGRTFINGTPATLQMASRLAGELISIAGQHEYQILLRPQNHLLLLDAYGGLSATRTVLQGRYRDWQTVLQRYKDLLDRQTSELARRELLAYQLEEITSANLRPGEEEELIEERSVLSSSEKRRDLARGAFDLLYAAGASVTERLDESRALCRGLAEIDKAVSTILDSLDSASYQVEDAAFRLRAYVQGIHGDRNRLQVIEERLYELSRLKKKYVTDVQGICALRSEIADQLKMLETAEEELTDLQVAMDKAEGEVLKMASELSSERRVAAEHLAEAVCQALDSLHMRGTRFAVDFKAPQQAVASVLSENGIDGVQFLIAPNAGEALKPLAQIASGGELSRITLALRSLLTQRDEIGTLIFDEVDAGIGGGVAEVVGRKLKELARDHQVVCITHLPQIACLADTHYLVTKESDKELTAITVRTLTHDERVEEIARMLGGLEISEKTRAHAREMIDRAER